MSTAFPKAWAAVRDRWATIGLCLMFLALAAPFLWNIAHYGSWESARIAESSIYSLDKGRYFADLFSGRSLFNAGQYSIFVLNYAVLYGLWAALDTVLPDVASYCVLVLGFYLLGYVFFIRVFLTLVHGPGRSVSDPERLLVGLMGLLYFSSLSFFDYIKSNILFALPFLILPALLYFGLRYLRSGNAWLLLPYLCVSLVLTDFNLAHTLILAGFANVFLIVAAWYDRAPWTVSVRRIVTLDAVLIPAMTFLLAIVLGNALYASSLSTFAAIVVENMYSDNARYLNIFTQLTDWGLFGSWNGEPYYGYAPFYTLQFTWSFGLLPFALLAYGALVSNAGRTRRLAIALLGILVVVFAIMLGNNNPAYRFLYEHVVLFQIFRNITKLAPLLYLLVLLAAYAFLQSRLRERKHYGAATVLLLLALAYNIPFWSYTGYFLRDRTVRDVPPYWQQASAYLNSQLAPDSRILALPAIYINDIYNWDGKATWVQGSLLDVLVRNKSYRLSECCIGTPGFQDDAKRLFVPSARSVRKLDVDYAGLSRFVRKYHLDYVVVTADLRSEYENLDDVRRWLARDSYEEVASFGKVSIYRNASNRGSLFAGVTSYRRMNNLRYDARITGLRGRRTIRFSAPFNRGWVLRVVGPPAASGVSGVVDELRGAFARNPFFATHAPAADGGNAWTLDESFVKRNYPSSMYRVNGDGSIDFEIGLYFKPQAFTYALLLIGSLTFFIVLCLIVAAAVNARDSLNAKKVIAVTAIVVVAVVAALALRGWRGQTQPAWQKQAQLDWALSAMQSSARVATEVYAPDFCQGGIGTCVRFYAKDSSGSQHTWGWEFDPKANRLRECLSYPDISGSCAQWADSGAADVARFDVRPIPAVVKGDSAVLITLDGSGLQRHTTVASGQQPFSQTVVANGTLPKLGQNVEAADSRIAFIFPGQASRNAAFSLENYAAYVKYVGQPHWSVSNCGVIANPSIASDDAQNGSLSVRVTPQRAGVCAFSVSAAPTQRIAGPATVDVTVMGGLSWSQRLEQTHQSLEFASSGAAAQTLTAYKDYGDRELSINAERSCARALGITPGQSSSVTAGVPAVSKVLTVKPLRAGSCITLVRDQYASAGDPPISLSGLVMGDLSLAPNALRSTTSLAFGGTGDAPQTVTLYKSFDTTPIRPALAVNGCSAVAAFAFERGNAPNRASTAPASTRVLIRPANFGHCTVAFGDQYGGNDRTVSARISVAPSVVFESSIAPKKTLAIYNEDKPVNAALVDGRCDRIVASAGRTGGLLQLRPLSAGTCDSEIAVQGGSHQPFAARVMGDLSASPARAVRSLTLRFSGKNAAPQTIAFYKSWDNQPLTPVLVKNGCASMIGFYVQPAHAPKTPSVVPASTAVLVRPLDTGSCTTVFGDQYGAHDRAVTISVTVAGSRK